MINLFPILMYAIGIAGVILFVLSLCYGVCYGTAWALDTWTKSWNRSMLRRVPKEKRTW